MRRWCLVSASGNRYSSPISPSGGRTSSFRSRSRERARSSSGFSLGKVWRLIAMPAEASLDQLVTWILRSVDFDNDHLHKFEYGDRLGAMVQANHPMMDEGPWTSQIPIGTLPLELGQTMDLQFDFGDCWEFKVKLERVEPPGAKVEAPAILEKHGEPPEQYPRWDD